MEFPLDMEIETTLTDAILDGESPVAVNAKNVDDPEVQKKYKMMLSMWLSFCLIGFVWFVTKVIKGRQRIRYNFTSIEEQLKRMQAVIEERERNMVDKALTGAEPHDQNIQNNENSEETKKNEANEVNEVNEEKAKISPDAQKLLETLTKAFGKSEEESEELENVDENEENALNNEEYKCEEVTSRRRKFTDDPSDEDNVELIRDTIEDIIQEAQDGVDDDMDKEPCKKDD